MPTPEQVVKRVLAQDGALIHSALQQALPDAEPRRYLYDLVASHLSRPGKSFRASLCLASCRAFGGQNEAALEAAVALELLHNGFLIHDDIEDNSKLRRGRPALHQTHGVGLALNAGDALCALALASLARCAGRQPPEVGPRLFAELAHLFRRSVEGQAWELGWIADRKFDISETDYLNMVLAKTSWYSTIHPCRLGALIGSKARVDLDVLVPFGVYVGAAFQIRDDLDNLAPGDELYGKDVGGDILERKRTLPLLHLLANSSDAQKAEVIRLMSEATALEPQEQVRLVLQLMSSAGSLEYARDVADSFARMALAEVPKAFATASSVTDVEYIYSLVLHLCGATGASTTVSSESTTREAVRGATERPV